MKMESPFCLANGGQCQGFLCQLWVDGSNFLGRPQPPPAQHCWPHKVRAAIDCLRTHELPGQRKKKPGRYGLHQKHCRTSCAWGWRYLWEAGSVGCHWVVLEYSWGAFPNNIKERLREKIYLKLTEALKRRGQFWLWETVCFGGKESAGVTGPLEISTTT